MTHQYAYHYTLSTDTPFKTKKKKTETHTLPDKGVPPPPEVGVRILREIIIFAN